MTWLGLTQSPGGEAILVNLDTVISVEPGRPTHSARLATTGQDKNGCFTISVHETPKTIRKDLERDQHFSNRDRFPKACESESS
jgi:hypothetical protein